MESNTMFDRKTAAKTTLFAFGFWSVTALLLLGLSRLFDAIDISATTNSIFGV